MYITTDIPAGNGVLVRQAGDLITLRPDLRGNAEWWFYWQIAVREAGGRTITIDFLDKPCMGPAGPAVSTDGGENWHWLGDQGPSEFTISIPRGCEDLRLGMTIPYTSKDLHRALVSLPSAQHRVLCTSHGRREVPLLLLGAEPSKASQQIVLAARHHCCETMASFVMEGCLSALATDASYGELLGRTAVMVVPFMDMDGVEQGDQGKCRAPHDHNRDYGIGRYAEITALQSLASCPERSNLPTYAIDLHCPYVRGEYNEYAYIVGSPDPGNAVVQKRFAAILASLLSDGSDLGFTAAAILPHGSRWNTDPAVPRRSFGHWFGGHAGNRLATTIEIPYGLAKANALTPEAARRFGADLVMALAKLIVQSADGDRKTS